MQQDSASLLDVYYAAEQILDFTAGLTRDEFGNSDETQSAVLYKLILIGEAASRLSSEFREKYPVMPWRRMGLRNVLTHRYDSVDLDEVWTIVTRDVPALIAAINPFLPPTEDEA